MARTGGGDDPNWFFELFGYLYADLIASGWFLELAGHNITNQIWILSIWNRTSKIR
jgi:hypothetical protein